jgi:PBP1b-binding outer membrane lipoprotein LpoB
MRKLALLAFVTVAFVACNKTETPAPVVDTTAVVAAPVDTAKVDTTNGVAGRW